MKTYRMAYLVSIKAPSERVVHETENFESTLSNLRKGDPARPLFLPNNKKVKEQAALIADKWQQQIKPLILNPDAKPELFIDQNAKTISSFVDEINESPSTKDNYFENPYPANCGNCDGYHTVVAYKGGSLCVMCLDYTSDDLEYCSWCNEANTGDMSESEYKGCGQCDGNPHWKDD